MGTVSPQASPSLNRNYRFGGRLAAMPSAEAIGAAARDHAAWQTFRPQASGLRRWAGLVHSAEPGACGCDRIRHLEIFPAGPGRR
jgi:hypothetical protein